MTKKTKLIPFDYELYMNGLNPVIKDKDYQIVYLYNSNHRHKSNENCPIKIIYRRKNNSTGICEYSLTGISAHHLNDLMLEQPIEEKTFYININQDRFSFYVYPSLGDAEIHKRSKTEKLYTLKVTYTDEDLIK